MSVTRFRTDYFNRRHALGALGALTVAGCGGGSSGSSSSSSAAGSSSTSNASSSSSSTSSSSSSSSSAASSSSSGSCIVSTPSCVVAPSETLGPYPAFQNGIVTLSSIYRQDMVSDLTGRFADRTGVPLTMDIKLVNVNNNCAPLVGYDVYVWHCDKDGNYSYYGSYTNSYFLRAAQTTNACGEVTFNSIFPGWYSGRHPHLHLAVALGASSQAVTQMAWSQSVLTAVYSSSLYSARGQADTSLSADGIFQGNTGQIATTTGSVATGYRSQWVLGIAL
jgi:protocatechuate 3,4-dioxygenase beta subunit